MLRDLLQLNEKSLVQIRPLKSNNVKSLKGGFFFIYYSPTQLEMLVYFFE